MKSSCAQTDFARFDLDRYLRTTGAARPEAFDWSVSTPRLDDDALFCLGYMMDIESHTIVYLRELLCTSVAEDASLTAFLSCWVFEEFFHSRLLKRFLESQGVTIDDRRFTDLRRRKPSDYLAQKLARVLSGMTRHFPAVHMTWGAINELSTLTGYHSLMDHTNHPLLNTVLSRIIKDERRHFAFYFAQARLRLQPRIAQRLTSVILRSFWSPVGSPVRGDSAARQVCAYLFGDTRGLHRVARLDSVIARLPGLEWFDLAERYCLGADVQHPSNYARHTEMTRAVGGRRRNNAGKIARRKSPNPICSSVRI